MSTQWEYLLKNLGEWQGSFTRFSPQGVETEDTPTIVTLEGLNNNKTIHQVVRRLPPDKPPQDLVLEYSTLNKGILFFENGAFCQGSLQWGPYSQFGAEFGLIEGDRRLRCVQLYNEEGKFNTLTLIREKLAGTNTPERPPLTVEQLLGEWQGKAVTRYPDLRTPEIYTTHLEIERKSNNYIEQKLTFGTGGSSRTIASTGKIDGSSLLFEGSGLRVQILLLPDGASCNCPLEVKLGQPFVLEMGWLLEANRRQRIIRSFDEKGTWVSCTLVMEEKKS